MESFFLKKEKNFKRAKESESSLDEEAQTNNESEGQQSKDDYFHQRARGMEMEEITAPGNICGTNWKMGEISTYLWNPQACPLRSTPTHWSLNHTGPAALPQRIILNIK